MTRTRRPRNQAAVERTTVTQSLPRMPGRNTARHDHQTVSRPWRGAFPREGDSSRNYVCTVDDTDIVLGIITTKKDRAANPEFKADPDAPYRHLHGLSIEVTFGSEDVPALETPNANNRTRERAIARRVACLQSTTPRTATRTSSMVRKRAAPDDAEIESTSSDKGDLMSRTEAERYGPSGQVQIGNEKALLRFFEARFSLLQQTPLKQIQGAIVKVIVPCKSSTYPYHGTARKTSLHKPSQDRNRPDFWPENVRWDGPDRLRSRDRLQVLPRLFILPLLDPVESKLILDHKYCGKGDKHDKQCQIHKFQTWKQVLESILYTKHGKPINLQDKTDETNAGASPDSLVCRAEARFDALSELIRIAGEVEQCANGEKDETTEITYVAMPENVGMTPGRFDKNTNGAPKRRRATRGLSPTATTTMRTPSVSDSEDDATEMNSDADGDQDVAEDLAPRRPVDKLPDLSAAKIYSEPSSATNSFASSSHASVTHADHTRGATNRRGIGSQAKQTGVERDAEGDHVERINWLTRAEAPDRRQTSSVVPQYRKPYPDEPEAAGDSSRGRPEVSTTSRFRSTSASPPSALSVKDVMEKRYGQSAVLSQFDNADNPSLRYTRDGYVSGFSTAYPTQRDPNRMCYPGDDASQVMPTDDASMDPTLIDPVQLQGPYPDLTSARNPDYPLYASPYEHLFSLAAGSGPFPEPTMTEHWTPTFADFSNDTQALRTVAPQYLVHPETSVPDVHNQQQHYPKFANGAPRGQYYQHPYF